MRVPWAALARNLRDAGFRPWEKCENRSFTKNLSGVFGRLPYILPWLLSIHYIICVFLLFSSCFPFQSFLLVHSMFPFVFSCVVSWGHMFPPFSILISFFSASWKQKVTSPKLFKPPPSGFGFECTQSCNKNFVTGKSMLLKLAGWWFQPLWKILQKMFQTTNQLRIPCELCSKFVHLPLPRIQSLRGSLRFAYVFLQLTYTSLTANQHWDTLWYIGDM